MKELWPVAGDCIEPPRCVLLTQHGVLCDLIHELHHHCSVRRQKLLTDIGKALTDRPFGVLQRNASGLLEAAGVLARRLV